MHAPKVSSLSCIKISGMDNRYSHPNKEIVDRLKNLNLDLINTAESGAVRIKILKDDLKVVRQIND